jgi:hypothetical protein
MDSPKSEMVLLRLHRGRHLAGRLDTQLHVAVIFIDDLPHRFGVIKRIRRHVRHFRH